METTIQIANQGAINWFVRDLGKIPGELQKRGRLRQLLEDIRDDVIIPQYRYQFLQGGDPAWDPITLNTARGRKRRKVTETFRFGTLSVVSTGNLTPLYDTGQFRRSALAKARFRIRDNEMFYGNFPESLWHAIPMHELGGGEGLQYPFPKRDWAYRFIQRRDAVDKITDMTWDWVRDRIDTAMPTRVYR